MLPPTITDTTTYANGGVIQLTWAPAGTYYGYCAVADLLYEFPDSALYSKLTMSVLAQEITNAAQELQDQLGRIYQMPYAGTDAGITATLRQINAKLAAANVLERRTTGGDETVSAAAHERRAWGEAIVTDLIDGAIQWAPPFGDAVPMPEKPAYPLAAGATVMPDPNSGDPYTAEPMFRLRRTRFRRNAAL